MPLDRAAQLAVLKMVTDAILDTVRESEPLGAPSGILYYACMSAGISLETFQAIMDAMVEAGKLKVSGHVYHIAEKPAEC